MNNSILLCCGQKGCPELRIEGDKVKIKFDSGNTEEMLLSQAEMFESSLNKLKKEIYQEIHADKNASGGKV